jgi:hypothetical protein
MCQAATAIKRSRLSEVAFETEEIEDEENVKQQSGGRSYQQHHHGQVRSGLVNLLARLQQLALRDSGLVLRYQRSSGLKQGSGWIACCYKRSVLLASS